MLAHNGNLTNAEELKQQLFKLDLRHINTNSDSEVLLNVLAHELQRAARGTVLDQDAIFTAVRGVYKRVTWCLCRRGDDCGLWPAGLP